MPKSARVAFVLFFPIVICVYLNMWLPILSNLFYLMLCYLFCFLSYFLVYTKLEVITLRNIGIVFLNRKNVIFSIEARSICFFFVFVLG